MKDTETFDWGLYPDVEKFFSEEIDEFLMHNRYAKALSEKMEKQTSTRFIDWIDHIALPDSRIGKDKLIGLGFEEIKVGKLPEEASVLKHMSTCLFPVLLSKGSNTEIAIKVESIEDFLQIAGLGIEADGRPFEPFRKAVVNMEGNFALSVVERRGSNDYVTVSSDDVEKYLGVLSGFKGRRRFFDSDAEGMNYTKELVEDACRKVGSARAADAFFRAERSYWQSRNRSGQVQKSRQDRLGLGWGNHDHHTYRSSRENFSKLIEIFDMMGYKCRERYYAGEKAGWGAQVLEHEICEIVIFSDVDLFPEETKIDFAREGLVNRKTLGTVGLWIGLHGESILQAGMHHLEARFDFDGLKAELPKYGIRVMEPFSYFEFLKQAFTEGENWEIEQKRLDRLLEVGSITKEQYDKFRSNGAIGSHMENLQRNEGFKGFNKASVTKIILATDPRLEKEGYS